MGTRPGAVAWGHGDRRGRGVTADVGAGSGTATCGDTASATACPVQRGSNGDENVLLGSCLREAQGRGDPLF